MTADPGPPSHTDSWQVTYIGHATVVIAIAGVVLITDPILRERVAFLRWHAPTPLLQQLKHCDATLISHLHRDHCDLPSLRMLDAADRTMLVSPNTRRFFRRRGFGSVVQMQVGDTRRVGAVTVTATPAVHNGSRHPGGPGRTSVGFLVSVGDRRLYFAGDTDVFSAMTDLAPLDVALLPVAGWGRTMGPGHMDPGRAAEAAGLLRCAQAVPIHWGTLRPLWHREPATTQTDAPALAFAAEVRRRCLPTTVTVLQPGETLFVPR